MMILSRNKGISNYYEVCDVELSGNYEEKMLINNRMDYLPEAEIRTLDCHKSMYVKVDGYSSLSNKYGRCIPSMQDVMELVRDVKNCIEEISQYLLNPACLVLNLKYILYDEQSKKHKFIYVPNTVRCFKDQIKQMFEEIMRIFDHKNHDGVVMLYEMYSRFLVDNFSPEVFCKVVEEFEGKRVFEEEEYEKKITATREAPVLTDRNREYEDDTYTARSEQKSMYMLAATAAVVTALVLLAIFGTRSLKFSAVIMVALVIYIISDYMHMKKKDEKNDIEIIEENFEPLRIDYREDEEKKAKEEVFEERSLLDTTVLSTGEEGVSKLIPCDESSKEQILLIEGETKVGRQTSVCDYCINEPSISRVHAILEKIGNKLLIRDAGSTNGTYINETRLEGDRPVEAVSGDLISFAGIRYECR